MFIKDFVKFIDLNEKNNYKLLEKDLNKKIKNTDKLLIKHDLCQNQYLVNYHDFHNGRRCPFCSKYSTKRNTKDVENELKKIDNGDYLLKSKYIKCNYPLVIFHKKCNNEFTTTYSRFFGKKEYHLANRCPFCSHGSKLRTIDEIKEEVKLLVGNEYIILNKEYSGRKEKLTFYHKTCGKEFQMCFNNFRSQGQRCPFCALVSKGENRIIEILENKKIKFKTQFKFSDCRDKRPLPFDFLIECNNKKIFLIEYQGSQHYRDPEHCPFSTIILKEHDKIKKEYCEKNNLNLLIIPYWEFNNLEKIISTTIEKLNTN